MHAYYREKNKAIENSFGGEFDLNALIDCVHDIGKLVEPAHAF